MFSDVLNQKISHADKSLLFKLWKRFIQYKEPVSQQMYVGKNIINYVNKDLFNFADGMESIITSKEISVGLSKTGIKVCQDEYSKYSDRAIAENLDDLDFYFRNYRDPGKIFMVYRSIVIFIDIKKRTILIEDLYTDPKNVSKNRFKKIIKNINQLKLFCLDRCLSLQYNPSMEYFNQDSFGVDEIENNLYKLKMVNDKIRL
jgi:hypothetical protein